VVEWILSWGAVDFLCLKLLSVSSTWSIRASELFVLSYVMSGNIPPEEEINRGYREHK